MTWTDLINWHNDWQAGPARLFHVGHQSALFFCLLRIGFASNSDSGTHLQMDLHKWIPNFKEMSHTAWTRAPRRTGLLGCYQNQCRTGAVKLSLWEAACPPRCAFGDFQHETNDLLDDKEHVKQARPWELIGCWLFMITTTCLCFQVCSNYWTPFPQDPVLSITLSKPFKLHFVSTEAKWCKEKTFPLSWENRAIAWQTMSVLHKLGCNSSVFSLVWCIWGLILKDSQKCGEGWALHGL